MTVYANPMQLEKVRQYIQVRTVVSKLRVAIASSGLGHIRRGVETWASDLSYSLHKIGQNVTLFQGGGQPSSEWQVALPCVRRFDPKADKLVRRFRPFGGWRYGFGSVYQVEQTTFALRLLRQVRHSYDIVHVQDPWVAYMMERFHRVGLSRPRVILAHGTEEPPEFLRHFSYLQHLAPNYNEDWGQNKPKDQLSFSVPNFVDVVTFAPDDKQAARMDLGLPQDTLIILCVAAIKRHHKRIHILLQEFANFAVMTRQPVLLIVAGGREAETEAVVAEGRTLLGPLVQFMEGVSRDRIPTLYRAADVFALASLHEMMPISVLEALSSGLPVACNDTPTLRWMVGSAGYLNDISKPEALAAQLTRLSVEQVREALSKEARNRAEALFSETAVIPQYLEMYAQVALHGAVPPRS